MKYKSPVYSSFDAFMGEAVEIAKDRIILHNQLVDPKVNQRMKNKGFASFVDSIVWLIRKGGWPLLLTIAALVSLGVYVFLAEVTVLTITNPLAMALVALTGGGFVYKLWKNRDVLLTMKKVGLAYATGFHQILDDHQVLEDRTKPVEALMKQCVKSICIEVFEASNPEFIQKLDEED